MRINKTNMPTTLDTSGDKKVTTKPGQKGKASKTDETQVSSSLLAVETSYVEKARSAPEIRQAMVEQAKKLIESGELDTPETVRAAAEAIVNKGL
ncbi:MAG: flagellar biosynthesis anti-sigma factor FlgM [Planctomycetota bacterium]